MSTERQHQVWPKNRPYSIPKTEHTLYENLHKTATRLPEKAAIVFYETEITFRELNDSVCHIAGYLQNVCGIKAGDRVAIYAQNCPQYVMAYYGILRAGAIVVPVNPMNTTSEVDYILKDSGAELVFCAEELYHFLEPLLENSTQIKPPILIRYSDYLRVDTQQTLPGFLKAEYPNIESSNSVTWQTMLDAEQAPTEYAGRTADWAIIPYTSGSTGKGKGCLHTHETTLHAVRSIYDWFLIKESDVLLSVAPMFHVVGMQAGMNTAIAQGCTMIMVPRWNRETVSEYIQRYKITVWPAVPTMAIDLLSMPDLSAYDLSSLRVMFGGGSSMPEAVAEKLYDLCGITFLEGWGLTETMAPGTANPPDQPIAQCGGIPVFNTDVRIIDVKTLSELPVGDTGEIIICGPQVMLGYWNNTEADKESFITIDGKRFLRTGDLGYSNTSGYIFIVDRIKRMINASGFKVWPTEVESTLYKHPGIEEVCIIAKMDPKRGETVKAIIVKNTDHPDLDAESIISWARQYMAVYKIPRLIEFVDHLPKSGSGKVLWRELQVQENQ